VLTTNIVVGFIFICDVDVVYDDVYQYLKLTYIYMKARSQIRSDQWACFSVM